MSDMRDFRKRFAEAKQADDARNSLIEQLLQTVSDMKKTMDRNAFIMVLIDGDCMPFLDELIKEGMLGGEKAAQLLNRAVFEYLRHEEDFKHGTKVIVRVYANLRGLSKTYEDTRILKGSNAFSEFVLGFNKAHPLCDFVDAGNHKEAADKKLQENLNLSVYNVHCKQIIFGASADNSYASYLNSFSIDTDISTRVRLLKGPPFSYEFKNILSKFKWTEFKDVFRSELISNKPVHHYTSHGSQDHTIRPQEPLWRSTATLQGASRNETTYSSGAAVHDTLISGPARSTKPLMYEVDEDSDESGINISADLRREQPAGLTTRHSTLPMRPRMKSRPAASDVVGALIRSTYELLKQSPEALDFRVVKYNVEQELGLPPDFWGKTEQDEWFSKSKNIIKMAVEDWVERTDNPPPKNATWMLRYFNSQESPSAVIRSPAARLWRTKVDSTPISAPTPPNDSIATILPINNTDSPSVFGSSTLPTSNNPSNGHVIPFRIHQNSEGQRIDVPKELPVSSDTIKRLRDRNPRLCNLHHLARKCPYQSAFCPYDHESELTESEFYTLMYVCRNQPCPQGPDCFDFKCINGHMCPNGNTDKCRYGNKCRFADSHGMDTAVASVEEA